MCTLHTCEWCTCPGNWNRFCCKWWCLALVLLSPKTRDLCPSYPASVFVSCLLWAHPKLPWIGSSKWDSLRWGDSGCESLCCWRAAYRVLHTLDFPSDQGVRCWVQQWGQFLSTPQTESSCNCLSQTAFRDNRLPFSSPGFCVTEVHS